VRITSATGSTTAVLEETESIRPGVVSLPDGWSTPGVNRLTSVTDAVDALTGMPRLGGFPVTVTTLNLG
jgi:molydopterin dinucleotide binding protein